MARKYHTMIGFYKSAVTDLVIADFHVENLEMVLWVCKILGDFHLGHNVI